MGLSITSFRQDGTLARLGSMEIGQKSIVSMRFCGLTPRGNGSSPSAGPLVAGGPACFFWEPFLGIATPAIRVYWKQWFIRAKFGHSSGVHRMALLPCPPIGQSNLLQTRGGAIVLRFTNYPG
jgi:hypothetical protein